MTLTVQLDGDVYNYTSAYAESKGISMSAAISELIRRAEQVPSPEVEHLRLRRNEHGYLVIANSGRSITPEMVKELVEDGIA